MRRLPEAKRNNEEQPYPISLQEILKRSIIFTALKLNLDIGKLKWTHNQKSLPESLQSGVSINSKSYDLKVDERSPFKLQ